MNEMSNFEDFRYNETYRNKPRCKESVIEDTFRGLYLKVSMETSNLHTNEHQCLRRI